MSETTSTEKPAAEYKPPAGATREFKLGDLAYTATAEWLVLQKKEKPVAEIFTTFYRAELSPIECRPLTFVFNGGPGASSAYLHVGALGPRRVAFRGDGALFPPPVRMVDNQESWLHFSDLVFVDPVGTGFSRTIDKEKEKKDPPPKGEEEENKEFFQLTRDLESLCELISKFLSKHRLWSRPIFIAGESYGGFRVGRLARKLQESYGVGLNGAILISPALELSLLEGSDYDVISWVDVFPSMVLAAVHHGRSRVFDAGAPIESVRPEAERFATHELMRLLAGVPFSDEDATYTRLADMLGLDPAVVRRQHGRVSIQTFTRELLRDQRRVLGLYDATATSVDPFPDRNNFEGADPTLFAIERVFTGGINVQLRETLGVENERDYRLLNLDANRAWRIDDGRHAFESQVGATDDLRYGMALNPDMHVYICHGYYDLVTPYYASARIGRLLKLDPAQAERLEAHFYGGGHMFYTWERSRRDFFTDMQAFYARACS